MDKMTYEEICTAVDGEVLKAGIEVEYNSVSTDTRSIGENSIFIALKGANFNGNNFAAEASRKGARICIVDEDLCELKNFNEEAFVIKVNDGKRALLQLAKYYRSKLNIKVVGITGSTGKTSTKDLVAAALSGKYKVFKTKGNFNNEIGLPLMIFNLNSSYEAAVLEMGMSNFGEIHNLADVARPDIGIITNIGVSHIEFLKTRENILKAKLEITDFFHCKNTLIINSDNDLLNKFNTDKYNLHRVGIEDCSNDIDVTSFKLMEDTVNFKIHEKATSEESEFSIKVLGKHNISNALLAIACGRQLGLTFEELKLGFENIEATSMRLDIQKGSRFTVIDDSYNASPDSMKAAIDVLEAMECKRKIIVLGTMKELGEDAFSLHKEVGEYAGSKNIDLFICLGEYSEAYKSGFDSLEKVLEFSSNKEISTYLEGTLREGDCVLIKASRSMKFDDIVKDLKIINR